MATITKNQLKWQCRRGMLELDNLLIPFLEQCPDTRLPFVKNLLEAEDPQLYDWFYCGVTPPQDLQEIVDVILEWRNTATRV